jgi:hypothetical protein
MTADGPTDGGIDVRAQPAPTQPREQAPGGTASLVLGILGLTVIPFVLSIAALFPGYRAKREARAHPELYQDEFGRAGRILGWIGVILGLLVLAGFLLLVPIALL